MRFYLISPRIAGVSAGLGCVVPRIASLRVPGTLDRSQILILPRGSAITAGGFGGVSLVER